MAKTVKCASGCKWAFLNSQFVLCNADGMVKNEWSQGDMSSKPELSSFPAKMGIITVIKKTAKAKSTFCSNSIFFCDCSLSSQPLCKKEFPSIHTNPCERLFLLLFFFLKIITGEIQIWSSLRPEKKDKQTNTKQGHFTYTADHRRCAWWQHGCPRTENRTDTKTC